jgi:hypothetical protein
LARRSDGGEREAVRRPEAEQGAGLGWRARGSSRGGQARGPEKKERRRKKGGEKKKKGNEGKRKIRKREKEKGKEKEKEKGKEFRKLGEIPGKNYEGGKRDFGGIFPRFEHFTG